MTHRLNIIGEIDDQNKLENINSIVDLPTSKYYPLEVEIHVESNLFKLTISIQNDTGIIGNIIYLLQVQKRIEEYFLLESIDYIVYEELNCTFPIFLDIDQCMKMCPYKANNAFPANCRGLQVLTIKYMNSI